MGKETFKFSKELVPMILSGEKHCTWRLWDEKRLEPGDTVDLVARPELERFARARISSAVDKTMGELDGADHDGHEPFETEENMYATYTEYYQRPVTEASPVRVYHFQLTDEAPEEIVRVTQS